MARSTFGPGIVWELLRFVWVNCLLILAPEMVCHKARTGFIGWNSANMDQTNPDGNLGY
jgi:hypothetical protein